MNAPAQVEAVGLVKHFGSVVAVNGIRLHVSQGEVFGFLGPNGAGKTTTMRMITGFLEPDEGQIAICGINLQEEPEAAKAKIGYLPEGAPLYFDMTPEQFLRFSASARALHPDLITERLKHVRDHLELASVWRRPIEELSKGFKRRVGLAQAILHDPAVLILDEPTDGLDPVQKHEVRQLITAMSTEKAIIISTHILEEVDAVCSRIGVIVRGVMLVDGKPDVVVKKSGHESLDALFLSLASEPVQQHLPTEVVA